VRQVEEGVGETDPDPDPPSSGSRGDWVAPIFFYYEDAVARAPLSCTVHIVRDPDSSATGSFDLEVRARVKAPENRPLDDSEVIVDPDDGPFEIGNQGDYGGTFVGPGQDFEWLYQGTEGLGQCQDPTPDSIDPSRAESEYTAESGAHGWDCCTYRFRDEGVLSDVGLAVFNLENPPDPPEPPDCDGDQVPDACDSCPGFEMGQCSTNYLVLLQHQNQSDRDRDGVGDVCDNCPTLVNADQADQNQNGVGDACETVQDADGDGYGDLVDNCRWIPNGPLLGTCTDGRVGDPCVAFIDCDDGLVRGTCSLVQEDSDADGVGDVCEGLLSVPAGAAVPALGRRAWWSLVGLIAISALIGLERRRARWPA
jgi:hypothetical protein